MRILRAFIKFIVAPLLIILATWMVGGTLLARGLVARERRAWTAAHLGTLDDRGAFPASPDNPSALKLEVLAKPVGVALAPQQAPADRQPSQSQMDAASEGLTAVREYLEMVQSSPSVHLTRASAGAENFMTDHAAEIEAVKGHLLSEDMPRWSVDVSLGLHRLSPNSIGALRLERLLQMDALRQEARGKGAEAWESLHAAWILAKSTWDRPEPVSSLMALHFSRDVDVIARRLSPPVPAWRAEIAALDPRPDFAHAYEIEAGLLTLPDAARSEYFPSEDWEHERLQTRLFGRLAEPYFLWHTAATLKFYRNFIQRLEQAPLCEGAGKQLSAPLDVNEARPRWRRKPMSSFASSEFIQNFWTRIVVFKASTELTSAVLAAKNLRAQSKVKQWPRAMPPIPSSCPGRFWIYSLSDGGGMTVKPSVALATRDLPRTPALQYEDP